MQNQDFQSPLTFQAQNSLREIYRKEGILFTDSDNSERLNGFCRIILKTGTILQGIFENDYSQQVNYFGNYLRGWIKAQWSRNQGLHGQGVQYDQRGNSIYFGQFKQYTRHGKGKQYFDDDSMQGQWINGVKYGKFKQITKNFSLIGEGQYYNDRKVGNWKYLWEGQIYEIQQSKLAPQQIEINVLNQNNVQRYVQNITQNNNIICYKDQKIMKIKNEFLLQIVYMVRCRQTLNNYSKLKYLIQKIKKYIMINKISIQNQAKFIFKFFWSKFQLYLKLKNKLKQKRYYQQKSIVQLKNQQMSLILQLQTSSNYIIHNHKSVLTDQCYKVILNQYAMLRNSILSSWSIALQYYSAFSNLHCKIFFPIQLMEYYTGKQFNKRQYSNVRYYSKHLRGLFDLFRIHSKQKPFKKILIPIIRGCHFTLAVVIISSYPLLIQCCVYDSMNSCQGYQKNASSNPTFDMVQKYLIDYSLQQTYWSSQYKQSVHNAIMNMKFKYQKCPQQQDGISCGVFVCINMYFFAINKEQYIPSFISKNKLKQFRVECLHKILKEQKINFQQMKKIESIFK